MRHPAHMLVFSLRKRASYTLAAAGGCYVGAPPRPRCARYDRYDGLTHPCCAPLHRIAGTVCTKACISLFPERASAPLHPLDGRETAIPPAEQARSAKRCSCGMQFHNRTRTAKPQAEVCGPACMKMPIPKIPRRCAGHRRGGVQPSLISA